MYMCMCLCIYLSIFAVLLLLHVCGSCVSTSRRERGCLFQIGLCSFVLIADLHVMHFHASHMPQTTSPVSAMFRCSAAVLS